MIVLNRTSNKSLFIYKTSIKKDLSCHLDLAIGERGIYIRCFRYLTATLTS